MSQRKRLVLMLAALTLLAAAGGPELRNAPDALRAELYRFVQTYIEAANRSDAKTLMAMVVKDPRVTAIGNGQVTTGWEAIAAQVLEINRVPADLHVALSGDSKVFQLTPKLVLFIVPYTLTAVTEQRSVTLHAAMTLLLQKSPSGWQVFHEHNSAMPPDLIRPDNEQ